MKTLEWREGKLRLLDQTRLPLEETYLCLSSYEEVVQAIKDMKVRGAPALGVAAAYGVVLAGLKTAVSEKERFIEAITPAFEAILASRPTAVNIRWALERMKRVMEQDAHVSSIRKRLLEEAHRILREDEEANRRIGAYGAELLVGRPRVLTHCNAGALATTAYGTALGVIRGAVERGLPVRVMATETRPFLQGARLTAWELTQDNIDTTLITDNMAGHFMKTGEVDCVVVGADRIAANGDVANKIGTYTLAVLAKENDIPLYVAAPVSTIDLSVISGEEIPIEERSPDEVIKFRGIQIAPDEVSARHPAFDVTPHRYISAIITDRGVAQEPYIESLKLLAK